MSSVLIQGIASDNKKAAGRGVLRPTSPRSHGIPALPICHPTEEGDNGIILKISYANKT